MRPTRSVVLRVHPLDRQFSLSGVAGDPTLDVVETGRGHYETHLVDLFHALVVPDAVVLDIGANIGIHTIALAAMAEQGAVHAFEPAASNAHSLAANIEANGLTNVEAHRVAVGREPGTASLSFDRNFPAGAVVSDRISEHEVEEVERISIDGWAERQGIERLDLVKLDVEGSEPAALAGMGETIRRFRPHLTIEFHPLAVQRVSGEHPRHLYDALAAVYPRVSIVERSGRLLPVLSWGHLRAMLQAVGIADLFCSFAPSREIEYPRVGRPGAWRSYAHLRSRFNRYRPPRSAVVIEPRYRIESDAETLALSPGERRSISVRLTNDGREWFSSRFADGAVAVGHRWLDRRGSLVSFDPWRASLPEPLGPGRAARLSVELEAPSEAGAYVVELSLVQNEWAWARDLDPELALTVPVQVT